jgi:iron complex outermembrane receptor protein
MRKIYSSLFCSIVFLLSSAFAFAQTNVSGKVSDAANGEPLAGVNIVVKGRVVGTITDGSGNFNLKVTEAPPITLVISFVGYRSFEVSITSATTTGLDVKLEEQTILGQEIVVSASRVEESILESPVSIEKMDILQVQNTPADNYYKGLANLKGVDVTTSSINFQIVNTRGFGSTGNTRFVQLIDGMDTQAPALNFPIGNLNGPSELDVESVELIPGASSALYGPNAFNGIILVNSKNPFEYQGLSAFAKTGFNHVGSNADYDGPSPIWEGAIRYAKAFNNKFAFKLNAAYMKAEDWHGTDTYDRESGRTPEGFSFNPGSDKLHSMGDEASINLAIFPFSTTTDPAKPGWQTLAQGPLGTFAPGVTAWDYAQNNWLPNNVVSVTPFQEKDVVDYSAKNFKLNGGLYYRLNDKLELSYLYNGGFGTSVYTGAQRYSLSDFSIQQHRIQLRSDNFYVRAYTTRENSGDSYIAEFLAKRLNDIRSGGNVSTWLGTYAIYYLRHLYDNGYTDPATTASIPVSLQESAHNFARTQTDTRYALTPGTPAFEQAKKTALAGVVPDGPKFQDATNLYHAEVQYDFKNEINFMELQTGGSYRVFDLNSNGTIFDDREENITITEYGAYVQAGKWLGDKKLKLSGSIRYDKNLNFKGRFNPRISALYKVGENHNLRISYQTGFRIPSTQGQHIDLNILSSRLLGGLQRYADKYDIVRTSTAGVPLSYDGASVQEFRKAVFSSGGDIATASALLVPFTNFNEVKPEQIRSVELGYKSLINNNFLIDLAYYYNIYNDFITQVISVTAADDGTGQPNYRTILNGTNENTFSIYTNAPGEVTAQGAVAGLTYNLPKGYSVGGNYNWNKLGDVPEGFIAEFNTPEHKVNLSFGNRKLTDKIGFNLAWRWQAAFDWQSSFTQYTLYPVPAYNTFDAQVSYRIPSIKSLIKVGGSNIANNKYVQSGGGPNISGLYYISITFDELMR